MPLPPGFQLEGPQPAAQMPPKVPNGFQLEQPDSVQTRVQDLYARPWGSGIPQFAYDTGGKVTDLATGMGASPETAAKVGWGANVLTEGIPALLQGRLAQESIAPALESAGRNLMQRALKPPLAAQESGDAARAVETMLKEGYNPTLGAVKDMGQRIGTLGDQIKAALANSPETVSKAAVGQRLLETYNKFKSQVNPTADLAALRAAWDEFKNHPDLIGKTDIPIQLAQKMKQGTYAQLGERVYGELGSASTEAQKQLARGLKETIGEKVPSLLPWLEEQGSLVNAKALALRRALMSGNNNVMGLAPLAESKEAAIGFLADKSDIVKSLLARLLYSNAKGIGTAAGATPTVANSSMAARLREEQ